MRHRVNTTMARIARGLDMTVDALMALDVREVVRLRRRVAHSW